MTMNWWAIIGYLIALGSFSFAFRNEMRRRKERLHRQQRFEWDHITQGVRQLSKQIKRSGFAPDFLVGIPGAGMILVELAVIEFGEQIPIYNIQQKPRTSAASFFGIGVEVQTAKWRYWIPSEILQQHSQSALLFDDYAQSGDTLFTLRRALLENGFVEANVCTAALISVRGLQESGKAPDHTWFWVDTFDVHMPWGHASKRIRTGEVAAA